MNESEAIKPNRDRNRDRDEDPDRTAQGTCQSLESTSSPRRCITTRPDLDFCFSTRTSFAENREIRNRFAHDRPAAGYALEQLLVLLDFAGVRSSMLSHLKAEEVVDRSERLGFLRGDVDTPASRK